MKYKKIGILTWHYYNNFGSGLQAFALQELISGIGYDVRIINYRNPIFGKRSWWKTIVKFLLHNTIGNLDENVYKKTLQGTKTFQRRYLRQTKYFSDPKYIAEIVKSYSILVYGSDQIWAPNVYNAIYMGAYIPKGIQKISYAASIGLNEIPDSLLKYYKNNLSYYKAISVRENEGQELLNNRCGIDARVVLDPTLMIDVEVYRKMRKPVRGVKGKFVYCYFLNKEHNYREKVEKYAQERDLQIIGSSDKETDSAWMNRLTNLGADHFLWLIDNAETVFTDSYHGSIFSLLFHKNLWIFMRFKENNPVCQNSRIRQLQNNFDISHRVISANNRIDDSKIIDFNSFERNLDKLRSESMKYLREALK